MERGYDLMHAEWQPSGRTGLKYYNYYCLLVRQIMVFTQAAANGKIPDFKRGWGGWVERLGIGVGKLLVNFCSSHVGSRETRCK